MGALLELQEGKQAHWAIRVPTVGTPTPSEYFQRIRFFMTKPRKPSRSGRLWGLSPGVQVFAHELRGSQPWKCIMNSGAPSRVSFHGSPPTKGALHRAVQRLTCCVRIVCKSTCGAPAMLSTHACRASTLHTALSSHTFTPSAQVSYATLDSRPRVCNMGR